MGKRRVPEVPPDPIDSLLAKAVDGTLDLHGQVAAAAGKQVELFLARWSATKPGAVVRIITGRGKRSVGAPVLEPMVQKLLAGPLSHLIAEFRSDVGGGAFVVRVAG